MATTSFDAVENTSMTWISNGILQLWQNAVDGQCRGAAGTD